MSAEYNRGTLLGAEWDRDFHRETHPSDHRDWSQPRPWDADHALVYNGSQKGWYVAPSVLDASPSWRGVTREEQMAGVYVIQARPSGLVKIGYASDALARLSSLQVGSPETLRLLFVLDVPRAHEKRIHDEMRAHHIRAEWFAPSVLEALESIKDDS